MRSIEVPDYQSENLLGHSKQLNQSRENSLETFESNYKKILADARGYFKQRNIEEGNGAPRFQKEPQKKPSETQRALYETQRDLYETQKALSETQEKYESLKSKSDQLIFIYTKKIEQLKAEKEQVIPKDFTIEIQETLYRERARYKELENQVNKNNQMIEQLTLEKKRLKSELEKSRKHSYSSTNKVKEKSKTTLFDIISSFLLIGANFLFVFVIYPNIANWIETAGLNGLPLSIRILVTGMGTIIGIFCIVKARKPNLRRDSPDHRKREVRNLYLLLGAILVGTVLLLLFLFRSNFFFFMVGLLLIVVTGLFAVIEHEEPRNWKEI